MRKLAIIIAAIILACSCAEAARIHGTIYDSGLNVAGNVQVSISTVPEQNYISKDGKYSFEVPEGRYELRAILLDETNEMYASEEIEVENEGAFVIDLILFEDLSKDEEILANTNEEFTFENFSDSGWQYLWLGIPAAVLILLVFLASIKKKRKNQISAFETEDEGLKRIIEIIKANGGRATQKDVRKRFPLSEAKISLMISELEHKGKIEKIKKGRGNILIIR